MKQYLRQLPAIHELQKDPRFEDLKIEFRLNDAQLTDFLQREVGRLRQSLLAEETEVEGLAPDFTGQLFKSVETRVSMCRQIGCHG